MRDTLSLEMTPVNVQGGCYPCLEQWLQAQTSSLVKGPTLSALLWHVSLTSGVIVAFDPADDSHNDKGKGICKEIYFLIPDVASAHNIYKANHEF